MPDPDRVLLVSPDLLAGSRLAGLAAGCGLVLETVRSLELPPPGTGYRVAILDLQGLGGAADAVVATARERLASHGPQAGIGPALIAFGPHVAAASLAAARAAGADAVSRGELLGGFAAVVGRHCG